MAAAWMTRVVLLRTGLPLDRSGGALPKLALPFRFFAGGRVGSGDQYWSWIHREDWTRMVRWAIDTAAIKGALNVTAPSPATNREFTKAVARALHRPALVPAPAFALRLMLGEMADALILNGQRVLPAKATINGFEFGIRILIPRCARSMPGLTLRRARVTSSKSRGMTRPAPPTLCSARAPTSSRRPDRRPALAVEHDLLRRQRLAVEARFASMSWRTVLPLIVTPANSPRDLE